MTTFAGQTNGFETRTITYREYITWLRALANALPADQQTGPAYEDVRAGYESPYRFGRELRRLAGNDDAAILHVVQGAGRLYFAEPSFGERPADSTTAILATYTVG